MHTRRNCITGSWSSRHDQCIGTESREDRPHCVDDRAAGFHWQADQGRRRSLHERARRHRRRQKDPDHSS